MSCSYGGVLSLFPFNKRSGLRRTDGKRALEIMKNSIQGNNEYNIWFLYQCELLNLIEKKDREITEKLTYMLESQDSSDILYSAMALLFILKHKCNFLEEKEVIKQLNNIAESANQVEKEWIQISMQTISKLTI